MKAIRIALLSFVVVPGLAWSQPSATAQPTAGNPRDWTSTDGKKISAVYLGIQDGNVALRLSNGKVSFVPAARFSAEDNAFVRANQFDYRAAWEPWPNASKRIFQEVPVQEDKEDSKLRNAFVYKTPHFRFTSDVNLGTHLMKDLAMVFELTYNLQKYSPLGTLAEPENGLFEAKLFGTRDAYKNAGGPEQSAGVYQLKNKEFLAPLDLMGVKEGSAGWRRDSGNFDLSTVVHELTHMLTHGMLDNLPTWVNEGYAEYICNIPQEGNTVLNSDDKIRDGMLDMLIKDSENESLTKSKRTGKMTKGDRINFVKSGKLAQVYKIAKVLTMDDVTWATNPKTTRPKFTLGGPIVTEATFRMNRLYRTAHLIIYYFIQIEGEKGVMKIRKFLEENQKIMSRYNLYVEEFKNYDMQMQAFMRLPGVIKLDDGRIQYPSNLNPPVAPTEPFSDPNSLKLGGLSALLDGESAEVVGARIQEALNKDLGVKFSFLDVP